MSIQISELRSTYYEASDALSNIVRQLGFAGVAIVWLFRNMHQQSEVPEPLASGLLVALFCSVLALALDAAQYAYKALVYGILNFAHYRIHKSNTAEVSIHDAWNWPTLLFFWGKAVVLCVGYGYLLAHIHPRL